MSENLYDPIGGHTKEEADAAYEKLFEELHGESLAARDGARDGTGGGMGGEAGAEARKERVAVVGHRNPDTDSICSAIAYAELKNAIDPGRTYVPYRIGRVSDETAFVLNSFDTPAPELLKDIKARAVILVDHNDKAQSATGIEEARIMEIIDHHRLAAIETAEPVTFRGMPYGSTSTIVYELYKENGMIPNKKTAGLLCAAIISDTQLFSSPATTKADKLAGVVLAGIAGLDMEAFAAEMFSAGNTSGFAVRPDREKL